MRGFNCFAEQPHLLRVTVWVSILDLAECQQGSQKLTNCISYNETLQRLPVWKPSRSAVLPVLDTPLLYAFHHLCTLSFRAIRCLSLSLQHCPFLTCGGSCHAMTPSRALSLAKSSAGLWKHSLNDLQACKRPPASQESLLCMLHALLDSTLTLDGLFQGAASGADPAQANAWLQAHVEGCLMRSAASLARTVAEQYKQSAPAHQQVQPCGNTCPHLHPREISAMSLSRCLRPISSEALSMCAGQAGSA